MAQFPVVIIAALLCLTLPFDLRLRNGNIDLDKVGMERQNALWTFAGFVLGRGINSWAW